VCVSVLQHRNVFCAYVIANTDDSVAIKIQVHSNCTTGAGYWRLHKHIEGQLALHKLIWEDTFERLLAKQNSRGIHAACILDANVHYR